MKLGDLIEKITTVTGIKWLTKKLFGEDCGCEERKNKLNKITISRKKKNEKRRLAVVVGF
jgi:hypothetical protein